jgi:hypothetical protein
MSTNQQLNVLVVGLMVLGLSLSSASSRPWRSTPIQMANDYATITDQRSNTETVVIRWSAPPTFMPGDRGVPIYEKYVVVVLVHFHVALPGGVVSFDNVDTLEARDGSDKPLALVPTNALQPGAVGAIAGLEALLRQSFGRLGEGMKIFTFDAGAVRACDEGRLSIPYAGETYTWNTPFPGCSP